MYCIIHHNYTQQFIQLTLTAILSNKNLIKKQKVPLFTIKPFMNMIISEVFLFLDILFTSSVVCLFNNDILAEFYVFMQVVYNRHLL